MALDISLPYVANDDPVTPQPALCLLQNYPNPVRTSTTIKYILAKESTATLTIYNIKGQLVKNISQAKQKAGEHSLVWHGEDSNNKQVSAGIYFYRLQAGDKSLTRKLLLLP